jgi:small multidrug resistance pump
MTAGSLLWLSGAMAAFVAANSVLRAYAGSGWMPTLIAALGFFLVGNLMMVRLMRESGLALAVSISSVVQLVLLTLVAVLWFDERPSAMQVAGIVLGIVAVALIAWPQEGRG